MRVKFLEDGPILVFITEAHEEAEEVTWALCRCGISENKPHCDGKHKKCEFKAEALDLEVE